MTASMRTLTTTMKAVTLVTAIVNYRGFDDVNDDDTENENDTCFSTR